LVVVVASTACISPLYKRSSERFAIAIKAKLSGAAISTPFDGLTKDLSLHGCGVRFNQPVPQTSGKVFLYLQDLGTTEVREVRRSNGREVSFQLLNVPGVMEDALFAKLFLNPHHHTRQFLGAASLYIGFVRRLIGKLQ